MTKLLKNAAPLGHLSALSQLKGKTVSVAFTGHDVSSDGGLLLLRQAETHAGIIDAISGCLIDTRHPSYIAHSFKEMLSQRIFQIAAGYEDADDCDLLRTDDMFKIGCGRLPSDDALSSQPTMSRFENTPGNGDLYRIAEAILQTFIDSYATPPQAIILDVDDTNSETHGSQQLALFNQFYGGYCSGAASYLRRRLRQAGHHHPEARQPQQEHQRLRDSAPGRAAATSGLEEHGDHHPW